MKRGFVLSQVALLLLIGASILVLVFWLSSTARSGSDAVGEQGCRRSINIYSTLSKATEISSAIKSSARDPPIECEPREVTISTKDEDEAWHRIAEEFAFCWARWQEGNVQLPKNDAYCSPCSIITFTGGKTLAPNAIAANEKLLDVLSSEKPALLESIFTQYDETYLSYLLGEQGKGTLYAPRDTLKLLLNQELATPLDGEKPWKPSTEPFPNGEYLLFFGYEHLFVVPRFSPDQGGYSLTQKQPLLVPNRPEEYLLPLPERDHGVVSYTNFREDISWVVRPCLRVLEKGAPRQSEGAENI